MTNSHELVSVVILSYNNIDMIFKCINSVISQDYPNIQLIISDDGSQAFDKTQIYNYISRNKKENITDFIIKTHNTNQGTVKNLNSTLSLINGKFIKIIGADDSFSDVNSLNIMVSKITEHNTDIFCGRCENERKYSNEIILGDSEKLKEKILVESFIQTPAVIFKTDLIKESSGFDKRFQIIEDWPFWIKTIFSDKKFVFSNIALINYNRNGISQTNDESKEKEQYYIDLNNIYTHIIFPKQQQFPELEKEIKFRYQKNLLWKDWNISNKIIFAFKNWYFIIKDLIIKERILKIV